MRHIIFEASYDYRVALLIKASAFNKRELQKNYLDPLQQLGVYPNEVIAFNLPYDDKGKAPAKFIKQYLDALMPELSALGVQYLYVADANYFKVIAGQSKADPHFGYVLPCKLKGYEVMHTVLGLNHAALIYNPELEAKLNLSLKALASHMDGSYLPPGDNIIHSAQYPEGARSIQEALESLHQYPELTADIEAFSLRFNRAGIGTIAFAWDQHNGVAFACDYKPIECQQDIDNDPSGGGYNGCFRRNDEVRALLRNFFETYQGEITWHKSDYDLCVLIYTLWMKDGLDTEGLLKGLHTMTRLFGDTKIIAYLATNSTAGNVLGLKSLAHEFAGNWAVDEIKDIRKVPLDKLLQYNLIDVLSTAYVRDKYTPIMVADKQEQIYRELMLPSQKLIIQLMLTGMPLSPQKVVEARRKLEAIRADHLAVIQGGNLIRTLNLLLQESVWEKDYEDRKAKAKNPGKILPKQRSAFDDVAFNPNSGPQLQRLLYELMALPVLDLTDTKQPATGADTLEKLINHTQVPEYKELLGALIGYGKANKVLNTFIPAFEESIEKDDGMWWLHGSFNLGGTVSGRLSSSDPNLTNIPAGSVYGKLIKECFVAPNGWLFCGADFSSLEDYISALTTKDPNKLVIYEQGMDSHSYRALAYFGSQMPDVLEETTFNEGERFFKITNDDGTTTYAKGSDTIGLSGIKVADEYERNSGI